MQQPFEMYMNFISNSNNRHQHKPSQKLGKQIEIPQFPSYSHGIANVDITLGDLLWLCSKKIVHGSIAHAVTLREFSLNLKGE